MVETEDPHEEIKPALELLGPILEKYKFIQFILGSFGFQKFMSRSAMAKITIFLLQSHMILRRILRVFAMT